MLILGGEHYIFSKTNVPSLGAGEKREKERDKRKLGGAKLVAILQGNG